MQNKYMYIDNPVIYTSHISILILKVFTLLWHNVTFQKLLLKVFKLKVVFNTALNRYVIPVILFSKLYFIKGAVFTHGFMLPC